ncbi:MAG: FAD-binding protein [bacterium]
MSHHDVVVIGAGVGGGAAAAFLSRAGKRALVVEATAMPRKSHVCSGIFTSTFTLLDKTPADYPGEILEMDPAKIRMVFGGRRFGAFPERWVKPFFDERLYFVLRGELEEWILSLGSAELRTECRVAPGDIEHDPTGRAPRYRLRLGRETITADHLIGAGGPSCPVRRRFFPEIGFRRDDLVLLKEVELDHACHGGEMTSYFYANGAVGFGWVYPKGRDGRLTNVGLCQVGDPATTTSINELWDAFVATLVSEGRLPRDFDRESAIGAGIHLAQPDCPVTTHDGTCLLVGDAAAVLHRDFWNGITPAIESGRLAARHVAGGEHYHRSQLYPYLFRLTRRDSPLRRRAGDYVFRKLLPRIDRWLAR